jgi:hypothetical protein
MTDDLSSTHVSRLLMRYISRQVRRLLRPVLRPLLAAVSRQGAWRAFLAASIEPSMVVPTRAVSPDHIVKDQLALSHRLLSIEKQLNAINAQSTPAQGADQAVRVGGQFAEHRSARVAMAPMNFAAGAVAQSTGDSN